MPQQSAFDAGRTCWGGLEGGQAVGWVETASRRIRVQDDDDKSCGTSSSSSSRREDGPAPEGCESAALEGFTLDGYSYEVLTVPRTIDNVDGNLGLYFVPEYGGEAS